MKVNELFYSIQGEGRNAGHAALFVRFSGCNLRCPFCDTQFQSYQEMTEDEIIEALGKLSADCRFVVLTGGEPTMQVTESLLRKLHDRQYKVSVETNGAYRDANELDFDFITLSPKDWYMGQRPLLKTYRCDELKMVMDENITETVFTDLERSIKARYFYVQPCDTGDERRNEAINQRCLNFVKAHPEWAISIQMHKVLHAR